MLAAVHTAIVPAGPEVHSLAAQQDVLPIGMQRLVPVQRRWPVVQMMSQVPPMQTGDPFAGAGQALQLAPQ